MTTTQPRNPCQRIVEEVTSARRIEGEADVRDVVELLRLNYDRMRGRSRAATEG